jgi:hypothetical protein
VLRVLDPAERYFWLLDYLERMNVVAIARLDRPLSPVELAAALRAVRQRHAMLRARIDVVGADPVLVEAPGAIPLTVLPPGADRQTPVTALLDLPFAPAPSPLARCVLMPLDGGERSVVALALHHALADGRGAVTVVQEALRCVDGDEAALGSPPAGAPPPLHDRFPASLGAPRAAVDVLGAIRAERDGRVPNAFPCHGRDATARTSRLDCLVLEPDRLDQLVAAAHGEGATVQGALAAAVLQAGATLLAGTGEPTLCLATPTDLRRRAEPPLPDGEVMLAIGLLCTPYLVSSDAGTTLARAISEQTRREVARGESHLFYRFARAGAYAATDEGIASFARSIAASPQNAAVSNLGVVADRGDPPWVRSLSFALGPSPNQVAFVAATTYRGALVLQVVTDGARLADGPAERLVRGIEERTGARRVSSTDDDGASAPGSVPRP